ncbi:MAG: OmpH family outer membrane protein [Pyrinomonadaceae bacterium MAG19_C2-C3]|nr:OmpH family outer membrane protein [Pyrinomonadaceae bacterium MAG19_C2-C3]
MISKIRNLFIAASAVAFLSTTAFAQAPTAARPTTAAPQTAASGDMKFAVVYTEQFLDPKGGINRLISATTTLNREFEPRGAELQTMSQNLEKIATQIRTTQAVAKPEEIQRLREQAEGIELEMKRKSEDGQRALAKRQGELMSPLQTNINNALVEFAKQRGYAGILNGSQLPGIFILIDNKIDITDAFIADYNAKNPATAAAVTTPARR